MDIQKTKICPHCQKEKPEKSFVSNVVKYKDKVYRPKKNICNTCKSKGYRFRNPEKEKARQQRYKENNKEKVKQASRDRCVKQSQKKLDRKQIILNSLGQTCCKECGYSDIRAICFHHRNPIEKSFNVCFSLSTSMKTEEILEEAKKCDVLCLNCHQIRHYLI